ncbi:MAG: zf-HC2 domain-containing protein [Roseburia sp.]|nr:zf-HC2 domain-containing protein [Roseburia sp.]
MKYPCDLIRDILPLYHDEVASEESIKVVEEHLCECSECKEYYTKMCESDVVEPVVYDEELEQKTADSYKSVYKKVIKKACKIVGIVALSIVGVILALYLLVVAYLKISAASSWEEHKDVSEYGLLDDGKSALDYFSGRLGVEEAIWPEVITEKMDVQDYLMIYYCPWDPNCLGYMVTQYEEADYKAEVERLLQYPSTEYIGNYDAIGFEKYEVLAMDASIFGFVYALTDGEGTIIYVGMHFPGYGMDIEYEAYVPEEYLPTGLDAGMDNPTRQAVLDEAEAELERYRKEQED